MAERLLSSQKKLYVMEVIN